MEKVLIVDDSILNLHVLEQILEPEFEVTSFQDGTDLVEQSASIQPSLILLDIVMRNIGGFELLEQLKRDLRTKDIPVIIITGLEGSEHEERALECGAVDFIAKPFQPRVVSARVRTHVELYQYRKTTEHLAMFDALTEIPNRRNFDQQFQSLSRSSKRDCLPFAVVLCDIDFFKQYNDHYGHLSGDDTLRAVAQTIHQTLLPLGGFTSRYGGEEFAILLPHRNANEANEIMETVRRHVVSLSIPHRGSRANHFVTISMGGALVAPEFEGTYLAGLEAADQMLYRAKDAGRNQIHWVILS